MKTFTNASPKNSNKYCVSKSGVSMLKAKKSVLSLLIMTSLITTPSYAYDEVTPALMTQEKIDQASTNEEIGFGAGALIGGLIAGPIGAFFSGVIGTIIAKNVNAENTISDLEFVLNQKEQLRKQEIAKYQEALQSSEQAYQSELLSLENNYSKSAQLQVENLLMSLQFSTGSSDIQPHYQEQINALVAMLEQAPHLSIDLSGYTDLEGDELLNQALSMARVNSVKNALIDGGVAGNRIRLFAHGETEPVVANNDKEVSFYDRRVVIKLRSSDVEQTAQMF